MIKLLIGTFSKYVCCRFFFISNSKGHQHLQVILVEYLSEFCNFLFIRIYLFNGSSYFCSARIIDARKLSYKSYLNHRNIKKKKKQERNIALTQINPNFSHTKSISTKLELPGSCIHTFGCRSHFPFF